MATILNVRCNCPFLCRLPWLRHGYITIVASFPLLVLSLVNGEDDATALVSNKMANGYAVTETTIETRYKCTALVKSLFFHTISEAQDYIKSIIIEILKEEEDDWPEDFVEENGVQIYKGSDADLIAGVDYLNTPIDVYGYGDTGYSIHPIIFEENK